MALEATAGVDPDVTPFILEVVDEVLDKDLLVVKGRVLPKESMSAADVVVRLSALDREGRQRVSSKKMSELILEGKSSSGKQPLLEKGVAKTFILSIPKQGISNYQLEVEWNRESQARLNSPAVLSESEPPTGKPKAPEPAKQFIALRDLEVHRVPSDTCANPDECIVKFTITGELFNSGGGTIENVVIVAGFVDPENLDLEAQILENEKRVEVPNLSLGPGGTKRFKISLEKLVPSSAQVAPQPVVRIASFRSN